MTTRTLPDPRVQPTLTIPEAGHIAYGIARGAAYAAAQRGDLPTVRIGKRLLVPTAALYERLGLPLPGSVPAA